MIRIASKDDVGIIANLAAFMWNADSVEELTDGILEILSKEDARIFLQYENDIPIGFAQCQLRHDYVEGTKTTPVGYLEGIFIMENYRSKGYAKELLNECEIWAEANRIICFTKKL
ncbi:MAG: GNAT family N-acetyltransferase [Bacillus sp. (in: Bacteria)]|nr:GNAT family N-acetyltransferase [Bacillus sp. (in: firmicutes)]MCM1425226.1 GNAT family N-acetyltransferase [Eubacterium sp.]